MDVNSVSSSSMVASTSAAATASKKATLDYDTFLTLLVQQMKNQDPTEPMDATEQIVLVELDFDALASVRERFRFLEDRDEFRLL